MSQQIIDDKLYYVGIFVVASRASINAYLLKGEKNILVDTGSFLTRDTVLSKLKSILSIHDIDYVILTSASADTVGALPLILSENENLKVIATKECRDLLFLNFGLSPKTYLIHDGEMLKIGDSVFRFFTAPFVSTLDAMFAYDESEKVAFTGDMFSSFPIIWKLFDDEIKKDLTKELTAAYISKFASGTRVADAVRKLRGLDIRFLAPKHGPVIRNNIQDYIEHFTSLGIPI
ncbi:MAG: MBL fold metallo-hydrolase [Candidatus Asgardarchaeia archaeon]